MSALASASLTPHQRTVLNYIGEFQRKRGYSPSLSDLATAFGVSSKNAVAKVVNALAREGYIAKDPKGRIKIMDIEDVAANRPEPMALPLFGPISAGFAAPVEEQAEEMVTLDDFMIGDRSATFLLRVKGDSMMDAGIFEGDLVIVERRKHPRPGDIVVAVLDGEFTLKRLERDKKGTHYLKAENKKYPKMYAANELEIAGIVCGTLRKY